MTSVFRTKIFNLLEKGDHGSKINLYFDYFIMALIVLNTIAMTLETIASVKSQIGQYLELFEIVSVSIFTLEYLSRIVISDYTHPAKNRATSARKFVLSFYGIIDLVAIIPFFIPFLFVFDLRFIRVLRLVKFFSVLKIGRYNKSLDLIVSVISSKKVELVITVFVTLLLLIISSFVMFIVEGGAQPDKFPDVISSFWWAVATLTTVGYGDVFPVTSVGKLIAGSIAVLGIGLVALPTGLISSGFIDQINRQKTVSKCPHCGGEIHE